MDNRRSSRDTTSSEGPEVNYSIMGEGTADDPAELTLTFNIVRAPDLRELRRQLPKTVTLGRSKLGMGFEIRGVSPDMSRVELSKVLQNLLDANGWTGKHYA